MLSREQGNLEALLNLANVDAQLQHYSQALQSLEAILAIQPNNKAALYGAGRLLYSREQYAEAASTLTQLSQLEPGYLDTMSLLNMAQNRTTTRHRHGNTMDIITHNDTYVHMNHHNIPTVLERP